jgi:septal ring factor EnvC (AmiA/AmiB activator)
MLIALSINVARASIPSEVLTELQAKIDTLEVEIADARRNEVGIGGELAKLKRLFQLQQLEVQLGKNEIATLEKKLIEFEAKHLELEGRIGVYKKQIRESLSQLPAFSYANPLDELSADGQSLENLHRELIEKSVKSGAKQLTDLKKLQAELSEVDEALRQDKFRLSARIEDLEERQKVLALNRELASRKLNRTREAGKSRLKEMEEAKASERKIEAMAERRAAEAAMAAKNAKAEKASRVSAIGDFLAAKGRLGLPVIGEIAHKFGKKYDPKTNLYTFHKGIEISTKSGSPVRAVFPGKVAFVGRLGGYRQLLILDHGKQFYSIVGNIGEALKKTGDAVREGEEIARSANDASALYFEIRQRHVAVNPLPWFREQKLIARNSER